MFIENLRYETAPFPYCESIEPEDTIPAIEWIEEDEGREPCDYHNVNEPELFPLDDKYIIKK